MRRQPGRHQLGESVWHLLISSAHPRPNPLPDKNDAGFEQATAT